MTTTARSTSSVSVHTPCFLFVGGSPVAGGRLGYRKDGVRGGGEGAVLWMHLPSLSESEDGVFSCVAMTCWGSHGVTWLIGPCLGRLRPGESRWGGHPHSSGLLGVASSKELAAAAGPGWGQEARDAGLPRPSVPGRL